MKWILVFIAAQLIAGAIVFLFLFDDLGPEYYTHVYTENAESLDLNLVALLQLHLGVFAATLVVLCLVVMVLTPRTRRRD